MKKLDKTDGLKLNLKISICILTVLFLLTTYLGFPLVMRNILIISAIIYQCIYIYLGKDHGKNN